MVKNTLENKIRWYFENVGSSIDIDGLELLKVGCFDADGILTFPSKIAEKEEKLKTAKEVYMEYWKKVMAENERKKV